MRRKITAQLLNWQRRGSLKPLLLYGARQVGKSYAVEHFARHCYPHDYLIINFDFDAAAQRAFATTLDPERIVSWLADYYHRPLTEETLLFFDEIQACPRALASLKYFAEANAHGHHYRVIAAGSLLGVTLGDKGSQPPTFPVGQVEEAFVYPLDFEEFLWAVGEADLATMIREAFARDTVLDDVFHLRAEDWYQMFLITGGMPEVVQAYVDRSDFTLVQRRIVNNYRQDIVKYVASRPDKQKVLRLYDGIIQQLGTPRRERRFVFGELEASGTAKKYRDAAEWLRQVRLIIPCLMVKQGNMPMTFVQENTSRKFYLSDTGLLCCQLKVTRANLEHFEQTFMGIISENYVATALQSKINLMSESLHYWQNDSRQGQAEVDFMIATDGGNVPIEVKTSLRTKSKSLGVFIDKYHPWRAYRISSKNFGYTAEKRLKSIPHYAVFCIEEML